MVRASRIGMYIGRPRSDAAATERMAPDSQPAGTPITPSNVPPIAAMTSVSARCRALIQRESDGRTGKVGVRNTQTLNARRCVRVMARGFQQGKTASRMTSLRSAVDVSPEHIGNIHHFG